MRDLTPVEILKSDNCRIQELFRLYHSSDNDVRKRSVLQELLYRLEIHLLVEEYVFYPKIEDISLHGMQLVDQSRREHEEIKELFDTLQYLSVQEELCEAKVNQLQKIMLSHIHEQEAHLFPLAEKGISEVCSLGLAAKILAMKERIKMRAKTFKRVYEH